MAYDKEKTPRNDAPEINMDKSLSRVLSKQFLVSTIANAKSVDEDLTKDFNKSNKNAKTSDSIEMSLFANNLHNTKTSQHTKQRR